jgi:uncharacterized repeat protein (TIGR03847 family)
VDLDPVDKITADAVGDPGQRTFFLQARKDDHLVTVLLEKQQVELLARSILEILARVGVETGEGPDEGELGLDDPVDPVWRAGRLALGYEEDRDLVVLELEELVVREGEEEVEQEALEEEEMLPDPDADRLRVWATREQMLALSRHGAAVVERGRPTCRFCGNPIDPEGHTCPAMNGHGRA